MKNKTKNQELNFSSCMEGDTDLTPHDVYVNLAIDATLLRFNDQLPEMGDDANQFLLDVAHTAATAALELARVPDDWLSLVGALHYKREDKIRTELWEIVFELLPESSKDLHEEKTAAEEKILACAQPGRKEAMRRAMNDLDQSYMAEVLESIYASFALGYEIAHDPTRLIIEKGRG